MEKDYFLDRSLEAMYRDKIPNGAKVFICTKQMQPYAKELEHLNLITVTGNLTTSSVHARGQKVMGEEYKRDRYGNILLNGNGETITTTQKGRVTYLLTEDGEAVYTKEGFKYLETFDRKGETVFRILTEDQIKDKFKLSAVFSLENKISFKAQVCPYRYFLTIDEMKHETNSITIDNVILHDGFITLTLNGNAIRISNAEVVIDGKTTTIGNSNLFAYIGSHFTPLNNSAYNFNRTYRLLFQKFIAEQY